VSISLRSDFGGSELLPADILRAAEADLALCFIRDETTTAYLLAGISFGAKKIDGKMKEEGFPKFLLSL